MTTDLSFWVCLLQKDKELSCKSIRIYFNDSKVCWGKESAYQCRGRKRLGLDLWVEISAWRRNGNPPQYSSWKIPRTEEPGGLQSTESQRVGHNWAGLSARARAYTHTHTHTHGLLTCDFIKALIICSWKWLECLLQDTVRSLVLWTRMDRV